MEGLPARAALLFRVEWTNWNVTDSLMVSPSLSRCTCGRERETSRSAGICLAETGCLGIVLGAKPAIGFLCPLIAAAAFEMIDATVPCYLRAHGEFAFNRAAWRHVRIVRKESISYIYVTDSGTALSKQLRRRPIPAPEVLRGHKTALPRLRWPLLPVVLTSGHPLDEHMRQFPPNVAYIPKPWQPCRLHTQALAAA